MIADLGDAMDDTFSEDTLMEYSQDYDNDLELPNATKSSDKIQGTVEKLLTLLEASDGEDELSCSEDEGVEADLSEDEECFEDSGNLKMLYQLAVLLREELKTPRKSSWQNVSDEVQRPSENFEEKDIGDEMVESSQNRLNPEVEMKNDTCMWTAGWDACASEALRYLVEIEGLPVYHPTVLAMKGHLQTQRDRLLSKT